MSTKIEKLLHFETLGSLECIDNDAFGKLVIVKTVPIEHGYQIVNILIFNSEDLQTEIAKIEIPFLITDKMKVKLEVLELLAISKFVRVRLEYKVRRLFWFVHKQFCDFAFDLKGNIASILADNVMEDCLCFDKKGAKHANSTGRSEKDKN